MKEIDRDPFEEYIRQKETPKCQTNTENDTLHDTLHELKVLEAIKRNPEVTQKELAGIIGKSERTVKRLTISLTEKGRIVL